METIHFPDDPRPGWLVHPVIALGNFDGLHRGHLKIIERVKRGAAEHGGTPMAMTFDPHPPRVLRPDKAPKLLMTKTQRLEALHGAGISCVAVVRFTRELSEWDPETFVRTVLVDWLRVSEVWVGANFLFGHGRSGNFTVLRTLGQHYGFRADKIDPVRYKDFVVSSTRIRRLVSEVPLPGIAPRAEDALLGARTLLVAPGPANGDLETMGIERLAQRHGLHRRRIGRGVVVEGVHTLVEGLAVGPDDQLEAVPLRHLVAEGDHVAELVGGVDVEQRNRQLGG